MLTQRNLQRLRLFLLCGLLAGYFAVNLATTTLAVRSYMQGKYDTAIYQNSLWQAGQFRNPLVEITSARSGVPTHQFTGIHFIPIGFLYGVIYRFVPGMYTTAFLYAVFFTVAGGLVYLAARRITGSFLVAFVLACIYLWVFTPVGGNFYSLEDWTACYLCAGLYFCARRQFRAASAFFLLGAMGKEYFGLAVGAFGFALLVGALIRSVRTRPPGQSSWAALVRRIPVEHPEAVWGLLWAVAGTLWFLVCFFVIMPWVEPNWANEYMFEAVGGSVGGVMDTLRANPFFLFERMAGLTGRTYLLGLFVPLCFLSLVGFEYTFAIAPILIINFLANPENTVAQVVSHYSTWVLPFLVVGAAVGYARVRNGALLRTPYVRFVVLAVIGFVLAIALFVGLREDAYKLEVSLAGEYAFGAHQQDVQAALAQIPPDASVGSFDFLLPHLANRFELTNIDAYGINVRTFRPAYIICDALDAKTIADTLDRARARGLQLINTPRSNFYDSRQWEQSGRDPCAMPGYSVTFRQGSLVLRKRDN